MSDAWDQQLAPLPVGADRTFLATLTSPTDVSALTLKSAIIMGTTIVNATVGIPTVVFANGVYTTSWPVTWSSAQTEQFIPGLQHWQTWFSTSGNIALVGRGTIMVFEPDAPIP